MTPFTLNELLGKTMATLRENLAAFLLFAGLATMAQQAIIQGLGIGALIQGPVDPATIEPSLGLAMKLLITSGLLFVLYAFATGAIVFGAIRFLENDPATHGDCLGQGAKRTPALVGMGLTLALVAGLVVSLVSVIVGPLAIVALMVLVGFAIAILFVAAPILVVEETGIIAALRRSAALTKNARMPIIGAVGVFLGVGFVVNMILLAILTGNVWIDAVVMAAAEAVLLAFVTVMTAVAYHELNGQAVGASAPE